jgi:hypothetical protein
VSPSTVVEVAGGVAIAILIAMIVWWGRDLPRDG